MVKILRHALGLVKTRVLGARVEGDRVVVPVRPHAREQLRCPHCGRRAPAYDRPRAPRLWRAPDLALARCYLEYAPARVRCPEHGVVTERVPWAHRASRFTSAFEDQLAWLSVHCSRSVVSSLMRVDWKSVGPVCERVYRRLDAAAGNRFDGLRRIGVDETSYKKGHKYMTVVLDHDTGRVVWCAKGHGKEVLRGFFDLLTEGQRESIEVVTADGARWIADVVAEACPNAERAMDPFHVVSWANDVLDGVRRRAWREARAAEAGKGGGRPDGGGRAAAVKGSRFAVLKNPEDLTEGQIQIQIHCRCKVEHTVRSSFCHSIAAGRMSFVPSPEGSELVVFGRPAFPRLDCFIAGRQIGFSPG